MLHVENLEIDSTDGESPVERDDDQSDESHGKANITVTFYFIFRCGGSFYFSITLPSSRCPLN